MIYVELLQKIVEAETITFSGNTITDSGSGLGDFVVNDVVRVEGSVMGNNVERTITSAAAGSIVIDGAALTTESTNTTVRLYKVGYFDTKGAYHNNSKGTEVFYHPSVISTGNVSWKKSGGLAKLDDGVLEIHRQSIDNTDPNETFTTFLTTLRTKPFTAIVKLDVDDTELFDTPAIVRNITVTSVTFLLQIKLQSEQLLTAAPNINSTTSFTDGRYYPEVFTQTIEHQDLFLLNDTTYEYHTGLTGSDTAGISIFACYDDGVPVEFTNINTLGYIVGSTVQYNGNAYQALTSSATMVSSPTGGASNNTDWQYTGAAAGESNFIAVSYNYKLNLVNPPTGDRQTVKLFANSSDTRELFRWCADKLPLVSITSMQVSIAGNRIKENSGLGFFSDLYHPYQNKFSQYQKVVITGSTSNDRTTRVTNVASDGSYIDVEASLTNESAGAIVNIQAYHPVFVNSYRTSVDSRFFRPQEAIQGVSDIADASSSYAFIKDNVLWTAPNELFFDTVYGVSVDSIDKFLIDEDSEPQFIVEDNILAFQNTEPFLQSISNPQSILETDRVTILTTGAETGRIDDVRQVGSYLSAQTIGFKKSTYNNFRWCEITYTIDGDGIDTRLQIGKKINFDSGYVSGTMIVQEFVWELGQGRNVARGFTNNITFKSQVE